MPGSNGKPPRDPFAQYLEEIRRYPLLSDAETRALARDVQGADWDRAWSARDRLIRSNLRLVVKVARRYWWSGLPVEDVVEEGNIGLMHAVEKYDPEYGTKFSTYAVWWIKQAIRRAIHDRDRVVRIPHYLREQVDRWRAYARAYEQERGHPIADPDLVRAMAPGPARARFLLRLYRQMRDKGEVSLDVLFESTGAIVDPRAVSPQEQAHLRQSVERLTAALARLPADQAEILRLRFGIGNGGTALSLRDIAKRLGRSRERVRQLEHQTLDALRRMFDV